jgi:hypothetical protein
MEYIRLCRSPEQAMAQILKYISWSFFLLLPMFALVLKLVYVRRKRNYMRHLIFSIHIHSFIFIVLTIITAMYMLFKGDIEIIAALLFLTIPVYIVVALKKFYGQNFAKVIVKFFVISLLYNLLFFIVTGAAVLNALALI